jgi:hypothetical protein
MQYELDCVRDLLPKGLIRKLDAALQRAGGQPRQRLRRRIGMDRRQGAGVSGVQGLQQIEHSPATHVAHDDAIGPMPERGAQQITDRDRRCVWLLQPRLEPVD